MSATRSKRSLVAGGERRRSGRALLAAGALNVAAAVLDNARRLTFALATGVLALTSVALGTYAGFSAQTVSPGNTFSTGTVGLSATLGSPASATPFSFGTITALVPGESVVQFLDLGNTGSLDVAITMDSAATTSSLLDSDVTHGLRLEIKRCSMAWTAVDGCPAGATVSTVHDGRLVTTSGSPASLGTITAAADNVAYLQLKVTLPDTATALTGLSSTIEFIWTGSTT